MLLGVQFLGILFALMMIYFTFLYYKRNNYDRKSLIIWILIWLAFLSMVLFPKTIYAIMQALEIQRTVDFFVVAGFLAGAVIIFHIFNIAKKNEKKLEYIIRTLSLQEGIKAEYQKQKRKK